MHGKSLYASGRSGERLAAERYGIASDQNRVCMPIYQHNHAVTADGEIFQFLALDQVTSSTQHHRNPHAKSLDPLSSGSEFSVGPVLLW